ncbi:MAG: hypothetical protein PHS51_14475 [Gallionella sp.]|nr:hypothetical protein [Gallionella sp.]
MPTKVGIQIKKTSLAQRDQMGFVRYVDFNFDWIPTCVGMTVRVNLIRSP